MDFVLNKTGEHLSHFRNLNGNLVNLKRKLDELNCLREDMELRKHAELRPGKKLKKQVENWFGCVEKINVQVQSLEEETGAINFLSGGFLGGKVLKMKEEIEELIEKGSCVDGLAVDEHVGIGQMLTTTNIIGEAIKRNLSNIWEFLMDDMIGKIGVCGMGGVGKTTIMKIVNNQILQRTDIFDTVIWVTVSKDMDIMKLQSDIAKQLKVDRFEGEDETRRAGRLYEILAKRQRYVIILDDLWENFSLEEVGFPEPCYGSKLVITTRSFDVCRSMDLKVIKVEPLSKDDAWNLFLEKVGRDMLNYDLESIAKQVAAQCAGLPLAIVTVASSMRGIYEASEWRNARNELEMHVESIHNNEQKIFRQLRFSYDRLNDSRVQNCFLCCALYPEDHKIFKEELIAYWIDEGFIDEMNSMQAKVDRGHAIVNKLTNNCLLENSFHGKIVKMHDLVRDMALRIKHLRFLVKARMGLSELPDEEEWTENLERVSLMMNSISNLSLQISAPKFQKLTTLLLSRNSIQWIPDSFFEHMPNLKVLDLSSNPILSLPDSIANLNYLASLLLCYCSSLKKVPSLSNLRALKRLDLNCTNMKEVPQGLQMLTNLVNLDMRSKKLLEIPNGIFTELSRLQYLYVQDISPVSKEIIGLRRLEFFVGWFCNVCDFNAFVFAKRNMSDQRDRPSKYHIKVCIQGNLRTIDWTRNPQQVANGKEANCIRIEGLDIRGFIMVPSDVEELVVHDCEATSLNDIHCLEDATYLRRCEISRCKGLECVFSRWCPQLHSLHYLKLDGLQDLNALLGTETVGLSIQPVDIFPSLKSIFIEACRKIKYLFSPNSGWVQYGLRNLEEIHVEDCEEIEEIIESSVEGDVTNPSQFSLPKLRKLYLCGLPHLRGIRGKNVEMVCNSLQEVRILSCGNMKSLFTPRSVLGFQNLEEISIRSCHKMKELIESDCGMQERGVSGPMELSFHRLRKLDLSSLPELQSICGRRRSLVCNSLREIGIGYCPKLKRLPLFLPLLDDGQPTPPPNLQKIYIYPRQWLDSADWNHPNAKSVLGHLIEFKETSWLTCSVEFPDHSY